MKTILMTGTLLLAGTAAANAQNVELRFSTFLPPAHPVHEAFEEWSASLNEASGGTITGTLYPAQQLGRADDHYDMARDGIADMAYINVGYQAGRFPLAEAVHLPFMISDGVGGTQAFDAWYRPFAESEMEEVKYCLGFMHAPASLHSRAEVRTPDAAQGLKVRTANSVIADFVSQLGGSNVRVSAAEARTALESGVADAVTFPWGSISSFGLDSVVSNAMDVPFFVSGFAWVVNPQTYERLNDEQRAAFDSHCSTGWAVQVASTWDAHEQEGYQALKNSDSYNVYSLTGDELGAWLEAAEQAQQRWADNAEAAGIDAPLAVLEELREALRSEGAALQ